jgi:hypothetical protein
MRTPLKLLNMSEDGSVTALQFRDDDRTGFELNIIRARDGDFHIGLSTNMDDCHAAGEDPTDFDGALFRASVRVRVPMAGGGDHEELWHALAGLFKKAEQNAS